MSDHQRGGGGGFGEPPMSIQVGHAGGGTGATGAITPTELAPPALAENEAAPVIPSGPDPVGARKHGTVASYPAPTLIPPPAAPAVARLTTPS